MNYALLFLDRALQGQSGSVCMSACGRSLVHAGNTVCKAYNHGTYVDTNHCDYTLKTLICV